MIDVVLENEIEKNVISYFEENKQKYIDVSKEIWDYAETQFKEYRSSEALIKLLENEGFEIEKGVAGIPTAFVATYSNGEGFTVGTMGEYDALKGLGYEIADHKVPNGKSGHGCGHNLLGTGAAGACIAVKHIMNELNIKGTVKFFGCPAEEGGSAKVFMVREGVFAGVDANISWHPANANIVSMQAAMAIMSVRYQFHGRAAHAGVCPQLGRSALDAAILMDVGANYLREHVSPDVRIQSVISNGGMVPNVVPDEAEIWYYLRAPKRQSLDEVFERMNKIAQGMAMATETTVDIKVGAGASSNGMPNLVLTKMVHKNMKKLGGPKFTEDEWSFAEKLNKEVTIGEKKQSMSQMYHIYDPDIYRLDLCETVSDDLMLGVVAPFSGDGSDVAWNVPSCALNTCCQPVGTGNHSWQQCVCAGSSIGQKGMLVAAEVIAMSMLEALADSELIKSAHKELDDQLAEYPYSCPIPDDVKPDLTGGD